MASDAVSPAPRRWIVSLGLDVPPTKIEQYKLEESSN
jgi:hypothetical protein